MRCWRSAVLHPEARFLDDAELAVWGGELENLPVLHAVDHHMDLSAHHVARLRVKLKIPVLESNAFLLQCNPGGIQDVTRQRTFDNGQRCFLSIVRFGLRPSDSRYGKGSGEAKGREQGGCGSNHAPKIRGCTQFAHRPLCPVSLAVHPL